MHDVSTHWIGFVEFNADSGEKYGYYFGDTDETRRLLESPEAHVAKLKKDYNERGYTTDQDYIFESRDDPFTYRDLQMIQYGSWEQTLDRVIVPMEGTEALRQLLCVKCFENLPYRGFFTATGAIYDASYHLAMYQVRPTMYRITYP